MITLGFTIRHAPVAKELPLDSLRELSDSLRDMGAVEGDLLTGDVWVEVDVDGDLWDACDEWHGITANLSSWIHASDLPDRPEIVKPD